MIDYLDAEHQLPGDARADFQEAFSLTQAANYGEAFEVLRGRLRDGNELVRAFARLLTGDIHQHQWTFNRAIHHYRIAIDQFHELGHERCRLFSELRASGAELDIVQVGGAEADDGAEVIADALATIKFCRNRAETAHIDFVVAYADHYLGLFAIQRGDWGAALDHMEASVKVRRVIGDEVHALTSECHISRCKAELGLVEEARTIVDRVLVRQLELGLVASATRASVLSSYLNDKAAYAQLRQLGQEFHPIESMVHMPFIDRLDQVTTKYRRPLINEPDVRSMLLSP
jgi:tetratricopeptide (TPR) repeat protein